MNTILLIVTIVIGMVAILLMLKLVASLKNLKENTANDRGLIMLNQNMLGMNERLDKATDSLNLRLDKAAQVIMSVHKELGTVQERFKGFEEFSELLHPKLRGNIGEQILADMLAQVFSPNHYELQYKFRDGCTVDALIKMKSGLVPIDSKFPLENFKQLVRAETEDLRKNALREFNKAVRRHIDDISKKYILPDEGTVNFAVMYVPSENVYYHILTDDESNLLDYAKTKNVLMTSPHGFFNFLRVILMGMERTKLQEQAQKIWDILKGTQSESQKFGEALGVLSRHVTNAKGAMDSVHSGYAKLTGKLDQVQLLEEVSDTDKPKVKA
ncbi:DNA recombination protein RmuC [Patescibacteria group bacterium]|nr:DNA recombination protein RmuC [Patescibacteria group bacterium]MBU1029379.1 DNA recombination protein RmuC [Patescibacteria group bacterium]MBU1916329.1 DNA recombination protein RmuC [Patescibacteria group bacterium]